MKQKGQKIYVPPVVIEELENIMDEHDLTIKSEGFRKMVKYAQLGRKVEARANPSPSLDLNKISPQIPIDTIKSKKRNLSNIINL